MSKGPKLRRPKSFDERRQELIGSLTIIGNALRDLEELKKIYPLRVVANQLRALLIYDSRSRSFQHPLMVELAKEKGFSLVVYMVPPDYTDKVLKLKPTFFSGGDVLSLEKEMPFIYETTLESALNMMYIRIDEKDLTLAEVIRDIADTESSHYDPSRPDHMDTLQNFEIGGLPAEYRAIYSLGKLVMNLGFKFVEASN